MARAVQRHARDEDALRAVAPAAVHAPIAAIPPIPPDAGAFFGIADMHGDPAIIAPARSTLRTPADLAVAVTIQRCCGSRWPFLERCAARQHALRGRARDDLTPIMPILAATARDVLIPDPDALVARLAHPDHHAALRRALDRLSDLPPEAAAPTFVVLTRCTLLLDAPQMRDALHVLERKALPLAQRPAASAHVQCGRRRALREQATSPAHAPVVI